MLGTSHRRRAGPLAILAAALYATATTGGPIAHAHAEVLQTDATVGSGQSYDGPRFHTEALCGIGFHPELTRPPARDVATPANRVTSIRLPGTTARPPGSEYCPSLPRAPPVG